MFDDLNNNNKTTDNKNFSDGNLTSPPMKNFNNQELSQGELKKEKVEDIYSGINVGNNNLQDNNPQKKPEQFKPKPLENFQSSQNYNEEKNNGNNKKIIILIVSIVVVFLLIFSVFKVLSFFSSSSVVLNEENNIVEENNNKDENTEDGNKNIKEDEDIDTDSDGLSDEEEYILGTEINNFDSDDDGLFDKEEVEIYKTDPLNADTDGDGFLDGEEVKAGNNPNGEGRLLKIPGLEDEDYKNTASSTEEVTKNIDEDSDMDGLTDIEEENYGTDILKIDTDEDKLSDFDEIRIYNTDPLNADTDGDSYLDGDEVNNGYNPIGDGKLE